MVTPAKEGLRSQATRKRREEILLAALACFSKLGFAKATMADIRKAANASTGSIYHHFKNKEELAGALFLKGVQESTKVTKNAMQGKGPEEGVKALVGTYLGWVGANPDLAHYILYTTHIGRAPATKPKLKEMQSELNQATYEWFVSEKVQAEFAGVSTDMRSSILVGMSEYYARSWLNNRASTGIEEAQKILGEIAYQALLAAAKAAKQH